MQAAQATLRQSGSSGADTDTDTACGMQAAQATLRQRSAISLSRSTARDASRTGYAEAKLEMR